MDVQTKMTITIMINCEGEVYITTTTAVVNNVCGITL